MIRLGGTKLAGSLAFALAAVIATVAAASAQMTGTPATPDTTGAGDFGGVLWIWGWLLVGGGVLSAGAMFWVAGQMGRR